MKNLKFFQKVFAIGGTLIILMTASSCSKKAECTITTYHAHKYINGKKMVRYIDQEYLSYEGYERQEEYIALDENYKKLYRFLDEKNLLRIDDNIEIIQAAVRENQDFVEYQYSERYRRLMPMKIGKAMTVIPISGTRYKWTRDPNHENLTGEKRYCSYSYTSYKIEIDENGKYVLIPCLDHKNIFDHKDEYPFIKEDFCQVIDVSNNMEITYEEVEKDDAGMILTHEKRA